MITEIEEKEDRREILRKIFLNRYRISMDGDLSIEHNGEGEREKDEGKKSVGDK